MPTRQAVKIRLRKILALAPPLLDMLSSSEDIESKRIAIRSWLSDMLSETYSDNPGIQSLEYILMRDAIGVFRKILSGRSEKMAGYSFLVRSRNPRPKGVVKWDWLCRSRMGMA